MSKATLEPEVRDVPLEEKIQQNPKAFDFSDIAEPAFTQRPPTSLAVMLGGFLEEISTSEGTFLLRPPKLKEQRRLMAIRKEMDRLAQSEDADEEAFLDVLVALGQCVLYVENADGSTRPASNAEIEAAFDAQEVQDLVARATGWTKAEGDSDRPQL